MITFCGHELTLSSDAPPAVAEYFEQFCRENLLFRVGAEEHRRLTRQRDELAAEVERLTYEKLQWKSACEANRDDFNGVLADKTAENARLRAEVEALKEQLADAKRCFDASANAQSLVDMALERDRLAAQVERLRERADAAEKAIELACHTRNAAVDALQIICRERDNLLAKAKEYEGNALRELCRADCATAERDELAALLREASNELDYFSAFTSTIRDRRLEERIDAALARLEEGK